MFDPLLMFIELAGGAVLDLAEALVRRRGLLQTLANMVVGAACGIGASMIVGGCHA